MLGIIAGIGGLIFVLVMKAFLRRNPDDSPVIVQYTPPVDESPTLSAGVLDVPARALAAHVVDLAVRDKVDIRASGDREDADDFSVVLRDDSGLGHDDRRIITTLYGKDAAPGDSIDLGKFASSPPVRAVTYVRRIAAATVDRGYRSKRPAWIGGVRGAAQFGGFIVAMVTLFFVESVPSVLTDLGALGGAINLLSIVSAFGAFLVLPFIRLPADHADRRGRHAPHVSRGHSRVPQARGGGSPPGRAVAADRRPRLERPSAVRRIARMRRAPTSSTSTSACFPTPCCSGWNGNGCEVIRAAAPPVAIGPRLPLFDSVTSNSLLRTRPRRSDGWPRRRSPAGVGRVRRALSGWSSFGGSSGGGFSGGGGGGGGFGGR